MQHELGVKYGATSFIRFGYWDSLKKGLMAGDHLAYDLKRLEIACLDGNIREYELTKHVSVVSLAPQQFLDLEEIGAWEFEIPEWLLDLDTPGHYMRRIKMVSVTTPSRPEQLDWRERPRTVDYWDRRRSEEDPVCVRDFSVQRELTGSQTDRKRGKPQHDTHMLLLVGSSPPAEILTAGLAAPIIPVD